MRQLWDDVYEDEMKFKDFYSADMDALLSPILIPDDQLKSPSQSYLSFVSKVWHAFDNDSSAAVVDTEPMGFDFTKHRRVTDCFERSLTCQFYPYKITWEEVAKTGIDAETHADMFEEDKYTGMIFYDPRAMCAIKDAFVSQFRLGKNKSYTGFEDIKTHADVDKCISVYGQVTRTCGMSTLPASINGFGEKEYLGVLNPYNLRNPLQEPDAIAIDGITKTVEVHYEEQTVTALSYSDAFLPERSIMVNGKRTKRSRPVNALHIVFGGKQYMEKIKSMAQPIQDLQNMMETGSKTGSFELCKGWVNSRQFILSIDFLFKAGINFRYHPQRVGDELLFQPGHAKISIFFHKCTIVSTNFMSLHYELVADWEMTCTCQARPVDINIDDSENPYCRVHGHDLSEILTPQVLGVARRKCQENERIECLEGLLAESQKEVEELKTKLDNESVPGEDQGESATEDADDSSDKDENNSTNNDEPDDDAEPEDDDDDAEPEYDDDDAEPEEDDHDAEPEDDDDDAEPEEDDDDAEPEEDDDDAEPEEDDDDAEPEDDKDDVPSRESEDDDNDGTNQSPGNEEDPHEDNLGDEAGDEQPGLGETDGSSPGDNDQADVVWSDDEVTAEKDPGDQPDTSEASSAIADVKRKKRKKTARGGFRNKVLAREISKILPTFYPQQPDMHQQLQRFLSPMPAPLPTQSAPYAGGNPFVRIRYSQSMDIWAPMDFGTYQFGGLGPMHPNQAMQSIPPVHQTLLGGPSTMASVLGTGVPMPLALGYTSSPPSLKFPSIGDELLYGHSNMSNPWLGI